MVYLWSVIMLREFDEMTTFSLQLSKKNFAKKIVSEVKYRGFPPVLPSKTFQFCISSQSLILHQCKKHLRKFLV